MNDPVAVLLVTGFISWIQQPDYNALDMLVAIAEELVIGGAVGIAVGLLAVRMLRQVSLASAGLYPVASLAFAAVAFGGADMLHGSGFLAVYLAGLVIGSSASPARRTITTFHDGLAWVAQLGMFLVLGLLVFPSDFGGVWLEGIILALVLVFVARPIATFASTVGMGFSFNERVALGWAGLRGAVPVVLATFPVSRDRGAREFFDIVFFAVLVSTLLQGTTFEWLSARLGVTTNEAAIPTPFTDPTTARRMGAEIAEFPVAASDAVAGRLVRELGLPREALLNVIIRGEQAIPPRGSTRIEAGDRLHVLVRQEVGDRVPRSSRALARRADGPRAIAEPAAAQLDRHEPARGATTRGMRPPRHGRRDRGRRPAAHPARPGRCARRARRRPLRLHGTRGRRRSDAGPAGHRPASAAAGAERRRASMVA